MKLFNNKRARGAISIFLVIITLPTILFSAVLIDGSRLASAKAMTQEAADLAAVSALADYNTALKDKYGLFAIDDPTKIEDIYKESLEATLLASGLGDEAYSDKLWEILKDAAGAGSPYSGKSFLNLYDFNVESCDVTPEYCLAEWPVLENQMVEYAKFRGIYVMLDRFSILENLDAAKSEQDKTQETAAVMEDKMDVDEKNMSADKTLAELREAIRALNTSISNVDTYTGMYGGSLHAKMEVTRSDNIDTGEALSNDVIESANLYGGNKARLKNELKQLPGKAEKVLSLAERAEKEVNEGIKRLEEFKKENNAKASSNSDVADLISDADKNINDYKNVYLVKINEILNDETLKKLKDSTDLSSETDKVMNEIEIAFTRYEAELERMREESEEGEGGSEDDSEEEQEEIYYFYYIKSDEKTDDLDAAYEGSSGRSYMPSITVITDFFRGARWEEINPTKTVVEAQGNGSQKINSDTAKKQSDRNDEAKENSKEERKEVPEDIYGQRPSKTFESGSSVPSVTGFYNEDGDLSASKNILNGAKEPSLVQQAAEAARDDVLGLSYIFGTFKTRLTGVEKFSGNNMSESDKNSFYMPKWRYAHDEGELDMRFTPKKDRDTVLRGEIEYIIFGNRSDAANENTIYGIIFAERLANNIVAMNTEKEVVSPACHAAAAAASALTSFTVPETVFYWIFITAWATAETYVDMSFLIDGGYRIPLVKNKNNIVLNDFPDGEPLIENYGERGVFVSYEDYLLIMCLIEGKEKRIMRTADLVEMNMRQDQADFRMSDAYTYLNAKTSLSTRLLFGSVMPFKDDYEAGGLKGRLHFENEIYLGY